MPREFPEAELEAIAEDCEQAARDWGQKKGETCRRIAQTWGRKAVVLRQAIDVYRERVNAPPITRRQKFAALVEELAERKGVATPYVAPVLRPASPSLPVDHKALASGDR
jgi:hypothetical protein